MCGVGLGEVECKCLCASETDLLTIVSHLPMLTEEALQKALHSCFRLSHGPSQALYSVTPEYVNSQRL